MLWTIIVALLWPASVEARLDPLRPITERLLRAEILIVLDTSGSMAWYPSPALTVGSDCGGDRRNSVDLCGDGLCSGSEGSSANPCAADCNISQSRDRAAGSPPACRPDQAQNSRMFMVKRVLRNLLPGLQRSASFGLVTFSQSGYHRYAPQRRGASKKVAIWLSRHELQQLGAWDSANARPAPGYTRHGVRYTLLSAAGMPVTADSLYARADDLSRERRFAFSSAGLTHSDGTHTWRYRGSYYVYDQVAADHRSAVTVLDYRGPQFVDANGTTWVHNRFDHRYSAQGISAGSSGVVVEPLWPDPSVTAQQQSIQRIFARLNLARNGGLWAWGGTPTGAAITTAGAHLLDRQLGRGRFSSVGPDQLSGCRPRFVLVLTDGQSNAGTRPDQATAALYRSSALGSNHVQTLVIGLPGLPTAAVSELDAMADMGDDGKANNSKTAYYAADETTLVKVVKEAFFEMVQGDYSTTAPGVTTSGEHVVSGDVALLPSTSYPGWRGQLRALDLVATPARERWDAGRLLQQRSHSDRRLYTGLPGTNGSDPVPLLSTTGEVNLAGGCGGCGPAGLRQVWSAVDSPPSDVEIRALVLWLAGKGRSWKLGPILRSSPATVGPPPRRSSLAGHDSYRRQQRDREQLVYITSNEGLLHAFRAADGSEAFAYVPPNLWPKIHALWKQDGQDPDPAAFRWILASSPRVEDIPPPGPGHTWTTQLMLTMGPGDPAYVVLDITNPSTCDALSCRLNSPPFRVMVHSRELATGPVLGETWSVPAIFYGFSGGVSVSARAAMGSGYSPGSEGHHYLHLASLGSAPTAARHVATGAQVDFALVADTAAAVDEDAGRTVIATYQGDLNGRLVRYPAGRASSGTVILNAGSQNPFYYSPALRHLGNRRVLVATASGSADEQRHPASSRTTLYVRAETDGAVDGSSHRMSCPASEICSGYPPCPTDLPPGCQAPGKQARPVGPPLLLNNKLADNSSQLEVFYLLYEPAATICQVGTSWLVRLATGASTQKVLEVTRYNGVRASGISMAGGRIDLAVSRIGTNGARSAVFTVTGNLLEGGVESPPHVESWRAVKE